MFVGYISIVTLAFSMHVLSVLLIGMAKPLRVSDTDF